MSLLLDVSGDEFELPIAVASKHKDSIFVELLLEAGAEYLSRKPQQKRLFFDRDPEYFANVLAYLTSDCDDSTLPLS